MSGASIIVFKTRNPRRNLPARSSQRLGESNFLGSFEQHFLSSEHVLGVGGRHFELNGYGIADFLWVEPVTKRHRTRASEGELASIMAFEIKLGKWKQALTQAYRYSYFADKAVVVLPPSARASAFPHLDLFRKVRIGLWFYDENAKLIEKCYTPLKKRPRSPTAKKKALSLLRRRIKFRKLFE